MKQREMAASELISADEVRLLRRALLEWGGPARCSDQMAVAMGFVDMQDLLDQCHRLRGALQDDVPLCSADWARTLLATEIVFVSDLAGTGFEWSTTTGLGDAPTLTALRSIQRKLGPIVRAYYGRTPDAKER